MIQPRLTDSTGQSLRDPAPAVGFLHMFALVVAAREGRLSHEQTPDQPVLLCPWARQWKPSGFYLFCVTKFLPALCGIWTVWKNLPSAGRYNRIYSFYAYIIVYIKHFLRLNLVIVYDDLISSDCCYEMHNYPSLGCKFITHTWLFTVFFLPLVCRGVESSFVGFSF